MPAIEITMKDIDDKFWDLQLAIDSMFNSSEGDLELFLRKLNRQLEPVKWMLYRYMDGTPIDVVMGEVRSQ